MAAKQEPGTAPTTAEAAAAADLPGWSAQAFLQRMSDRAHAAAGKPAPPLPQQLQQQQQVKVESVDDKKAVVAAGAAGAAAGAAALVPVFIGIDRFDAVPPEPPVRETFLYRRGDERWAVKPAASRFVLETGLLQFERLVEDQINAGLKPYAAADGAGAAAAAGAAAGAGAATAAAAGRPPPPLREQLVRLQLYVRNGDRAFRDDDLLWDVGNAANDAAGYAARACADLGLGADWCDLVAAQLQRQLDEARADLRGGGGAPGEEGVRLEPPLPARKRVRVAMPAPPGVDGGGGGGGGADSTQREQQQRGPRVEKYDAANDVEAKRQAERAKRLAARPPAPAPQADAEQQQQQQQQQHGAKREP